MPSYHISYTEKADYLLVYLTAHKAQARTVADYWNEIILECKKRSFNHLVIEKNFRVQINTFEIYEVSKKIASLSRKHQINIALVDSNKANFEKNSFAETVVNNWGGNGQIFSNIKEAEEWLEIGINT